MVKRISGGTRLPRANRPAIDPVAGLAGSIAHDYSNLLMVIQNAASMLQDRLPADDPGQRHISLLLDAAERGRRLTRELQAFGRSQLLKPEVVKPGQLVRGMSDMLRHLVPRDVEFRTSIRAVNTKVLFDLAQLRLVILNLVAFAAERVKKNGRLFLSVSHERFDDVTLADDKVLSGQYVRILVAQTGPGLDAAEIKRIFEPGLTGKDLPRGTDLRLASVQGVVTQSGGIVNVSSERGRGTSFQVYLPVAGAQPVEAQPRRSSRRVVAKDVSGSEVILVVEDDPSVRSMVQEMLERYGYTALEASDGAEALRVANLYNSPPDLLLTDLVMPELSGRELIDELRVDDKLPKVLLMSGYTDDDQLRGSRTAEYPFIKKPFTHYELAAKVREALDR
jgi:two-component system, cell cycle sensor histidine kinase and response regulator CckA